MMKIQKYEIIQEIGNGNFSKVYKARSKDSNQQFALKIMSSHRSIAQKQANLLMKMDHPNIAKFFKYVQDDEGFKLFLEYLPVNTLTLYEQSVCGLKQQQVKCILFQMALALHYIHEKGIVHRDIKPQNILIDKSKAIIKIIDFGLAIPQKQMKTDYIATRWYRSPENLLCTKEYTTAIDIFSLGCVIVELYLGDPLFPGVQNLDQISKIFHILGYPSKQTWPKGFMKLAELGLQSQLQQQSEFLQGQSGLKDILINCNPKLLDLIQKMLVLNPRNRISARDIVKHEYFQNIKEIIPPIVYQRYENDFKSPSNNTNFSQVSRYSKSDVTPRENDLPNQNYSTVISQQKRVNKKSQQLNTSERYINLEQSLHKKYSENHQALKFRTNHLLKMNSKFSLRQIKIKDQSNNRPLQPFPLNRNSRQIHPIHFTDAWSPLQIKRSQKHENGEPRNKQLIYNQFGKVNQIKFLHHNQSQQRINYHGSTNASLAYQIGNRISTKNLITNTSSNFRALDSSSPPEILSNNFSSQNFKRLHLKSVQSTNKIRKISDDIDFKDQYYICGRFHTQMSNDLDQLTNTKDNNSYQFQTALKMVESSHKKELISFRPSAQNREYQQNRKNSASERVKNLSATRHYPKERDYDKKSTQLGYLNIANNCNPKHQKAQVSPKFYQLKNLQSGIRLSDWNQQLKFSHRDREYQQKQSRNRQDMIRNLSLVDPKVHRVMQMPKFNSPMNKNTINFTDLKNHAKAANKRPKVDFRKQINIIKSANSKRIKQNQKIVNFKSPIKYINGAELTQSIKKSQALPILLNSDKEKDIRFSAQTNPEGNQMNSDFKETRLDENKKNNLNNGFLINSHEFYKPSKINQSATTPTNNKVPIFIAQNAKRDTQKQTDKQKVSLWNGNSVKIPNLNQQNKPFYNGSNYQNKPQQHLQLNNNYKAFQPNLQINNTYGNNHWNTNNNTNQNIIAHNFNMNSYVITQNSYTKKQPYPSTLFVSSSTSPRFSNMQNKLISPRITNQRK